MAKTYEQNKAYAEKYLQKLERVVTRITPEQKAAWQAAAARADESVNQYVIKAVENRMKQEKEG